MEKNSISDGKIIWKHQFDWNNSKSGVFLFLFFFVSFVSQWSELNGFFKAMRYLTGKKWKKIQFQTEKSSGNTNSTGITAKAAFFYFYFFLFLSSLNGVS